MRKKFRSINEVSPMEKSTIRAEYITGLPSQLALSAKYQISEKAIGIIVKDIVRRSVKNRNELNRKYGYSGSYTYRYKIFYSY